MEGRLHVFWGPMFSGKTTRLLEAVERRIAGGQRGTLLKHARDTRHALVASHDGRARRAQCVARLSDARIEGEFVAIDEAQFFEGLAVFCAQQRSLGRDVLVAGLNSHADAARSPWPEMQAIVHHASRLELLLAVCIVCGRDAECSRLRAGPSDGPREQVGGGDLYVPCCGHCYTVPLLPATLERHAQSIDLLQSMRE
jgi:thymidine kinase